MPTRSCCPSASIRFRRCASSRPRSASALICSAISSAMSHLYGTLLEDKFFSNRAYVLVDSNGIVQWSHSEDTPALGGRTRSSWPTWRRTDDPLERPTARGTLARFPADRGCRIEDRTYRYPPRRGHHSTPDQPVCLGLTRRDWGGVRSLFWQDGTYAALVGPGESVGSSPTVTRLFPSTWRCKPSTAGSAALSRRTSRSGCWTDLRQEGDLAAAWVFPSLVTPSGPTPNRSRVAEHGIPADRWRLADPERSRGISPRSIH